MKEANRAKHDAEKAKSEAVKALNSAQKAKEEADKPQHEELKCKDENIQSETVKPQGERKVGKFLSFGSLKQRQEPEENEYIEDNELQYIQDKEIPEIPNCPNKGDNFGHNNEAELTETFECDICKKTF